jgi:hypothetical protein
MRIAGEATLRAPVDKVWDALLDPAVLVRTIPGCERLEATGENAYAMTVTAGVAAIKGTYSGTCELRDLEPHQSLVMSAQGAGAPGTIAADVTVGFRDNGDGTTSLDYDADTTVGGMIGGVGQRVLSGVAKKTAGEFFQAVDDVLAGRGPTVPAPRAEPAELAAAAPGAAAGVYVAPGKPPGGAFATDDFVRGAVFGAGVALAGVLVGGLLGRRRG